MWVATITPGGTLPADKKYTRSLDKLTMGIENLRWAKLALHLGLLSSILSLLVTINPVKATTGEPLDQLPFAQTGHTVRGYFLEYWQNNGGLAQFGYPISEEFFEGYQRVQYFERARLEYHTEFSGTPYQVELSLLGVQALSQGDKNYPPATPVQNSQFQYFPQTGHNLGFGFKAYWEQHGGLAIFGYPLSEEISEISPTDGKPYTVQYFERNRFEYHPEVKGTPFEVELGLLGSETLNNRIVPPANATITIDAGTVTGVAEDLVGASTETLHYILPGETQHPDWNQQTPNQILDLTRQLNPATGEAVFSLRFGSQFDGGRMKGIRAGGADGYHWQQAFNPGSRAISLDEAAGMARKAGSNLTVQVNFGSGTAAEAAAEVAYTNGTDSSIAEVALRHQHGFTDPYNITRWEIGGELYDAGTTGFSATGDFSYANPAAKNGGDSAWYNKPTSDPANYAARAVVFARAMRAASPVPIKLYLTIAVPGSAWGSLPNQISTLISIAGQDIDGFNIHLYPVGEGPRTGLTDLDILAAPDRSDSWLAEAQTNIKTYAPPGKHYELIVSEYNISIHSIAQLDNLAGGVATATMLVSFANRGISEANHYSLDTGSYGLFNYNQDGSLDNPRPSYLALQLFATHLGSKIIASVAEGSSTLHSPGGTLVPGFDFSSLVTTASVSRDGKSLYLIAINRDPEQAQRVKINISGFVGDSQQPIEATMLNGLSLNSLSSGVSRNNTGLVDALFKVSDSAHFTFELPAHSVVAFMIKGP